jgi:hypothetical protein
MFQIMIEQPEKPKVYIGPYDTLQSARESVGDFQFTGGLVRISIVERFLNGPVLNTILVDDRIPN